MKTYNELIAEFMEFDYQEFSNEGGSGFNVRLNGVPKGQGDYSCARYGTLEFNKQTIIGFKTKYDTSWDWLMPVIEKIRNTDHIYKTASSHFDIGGSDGIWWCCLEDRFRFNSDISMIDAAYTCVIEFIKWHNEQNK